MSNDPHPFEPIHIGGGVHNAVTPEELRRRAREGPAPLAGVGPDAPTVTNAQGASQSDVPYRFDLIDPLALFEIAGVLDHGARKYGEGNWKGIEVDEHLNHLLMHAYAFLAGDTQDDHLSHIACRAIFALGVQRARPGTG